MSPKYRLNDQYLFDPTLRSIQDMSIDGEITWLGNNEANLLSAFIRHSNKLVTKCHLHKEVWLEQGFHVDESSVVQSISLLRKLLKDSAKKPTYIKTVSKKGYLFIAKVHSLEQEQPQDSETVNPPINETPRELTIPNFKLQELQKVFSYCTTAIRSFPIIILGVLVTTLATLLVSYSSASELIHLKTVDGSKVMIPKGHEKLDDLKEKVFPCISQILAVKKAERVVINVDSGQLLTMSLFNPEEKLSKSLSVMYNAESLYDSCQLLSGDVL